MGNCGESTPTFVIDGFQARYKIFDRLPNSNAVCKI